MTICVSVKVAEGLVLAADSAVMLTGTRTTTTGTINFTQMYEHANKVTQIKDYPVGVMNWGLGSISNRSIQSLIMEFEYGFQDRANNLQYTVKGIADAFLQFIKTRYDAAYPPGSSPPPMGLLVGGFSSGAFFADQYTYEFPKSNDWDSLFPDSTLFGPSWYGLTEALVRLLKGFDLAGMNELVNRGADAAIVQQWINDGVSEVPVVYGDMPIQDAIDFARYAVEVTIGLYRFAPTLPLCGGSVDIAVITPAAFRWAQQKQWSVKSQEVGI